MTQAVQDKGPPRIEDYLFSFDKGMDSGSDPLLLPDNQMAFCTNGTVRGDFLSNRPPFKNRQLIFNPPSIQAAFTSGVWQGGCYAKPDPTAPLPSEVLVASISGRLYVCTPGVTTVTVVDVTGANNQSVAVPQHWLWQSEMFVIWNDGVSNPVFLNLNTLTTARSTYTTPVNFADTISAPAGGVTVTAIGVTTGTSGTPVVFTTGANLVVGDILTFQGFGQFQVAQIFVAGPPAQISMTNLNATAFGVLMRVGTNVTWRHQGTQLPPGRMGAYVLGRNWMSLPDAKQFVASDIVGGASGTSANNYRDSVLSITENTYLTGGGNFTIPGNVGDIRAIIGIATIDASLGQGPILILTPKAGYTCQAPLQRTLWTSLTNPILTQSMFTNAGLGQDSTLQVNSDVFMRALEGLRSFILTRNDFQSWGDTTISYEMLRILPKDNFSLLPFGSAIVFNNRMLMTVRPTTSVQGVFHPALIAMNLDPNSTLGEKQPPVWDGLWITPNILKLMVGSFALVERAWCFALNTNTSQIEIHELLLDGADIIDDTQSRISTSFESPVRFKDKPDTQRIFKRLFNGEIMVDELLGEVHFDVFWKPDQWPTWIPWVSWDECQLAPTGAPGTANFQPGFRPRMGLGTPPNNFFDKCSDQNLREGYNFQFKIVITGHCEFKGARFEAEIIPRRTFAPIRTNPPCT